jgi:aspartyl/asparaginyl-tRNA synthetase
MTIEKKKKQGTRYELRIFQYSLLSTFKPRLMIQKKKKKPSRPCTTHTLLATSLLPSDNRKTSMAHLHSIFLNLFAVYNENM